jgi:diaminopimelate epimerase
MKNKFIKSHGLGNDYIVIDSNDISFTIDSNSAKLICDVHYGIGSDGLLVKVPPNKADFNVRMFNPDGSEFEKSGNGLRIFSKYLYDYGFTKSKSFSIETNGGIVNTEIKKIEYGKVKIIKIEMGNAEFDSKKIPVNINNDLCIDESLTIDNIDFKINCVSMGNPHCVVIKKKLDVDEIMKYGSLIETHNIFPNRVNVQFVEIINRSEANILIWERGVGFTNASGSSSCAVAAVLKKLNYIDDKIKIKMPGGSLDIEVDNNYNITMTGEVQQIVKGHFSSEFVDLLNGNSD